ncbi:MAG: 2-amino-4-hydroxy-6-hydroxymethyldihydropteridine diphosphokinase [Bacteroidetes bacterium]|nr:2-amino-4-hydroxy-6-hydroxymethyldihydropteridine diphosphokinase [Fibrella sp.]
MTTNLFLLLGANLGDRLAMLSRAQTLISERVGPISRQSAVYETAPWGVTDQPTYLNQVLNVETALTPEAVLTQTQAIEAQLGRIRLEKWGSRIIDIDVLYYDQLIWQTESLTLPHPLLHERRFTLVPLAEIAPDFVHPVFRKTTQQLLAQLADVNDVHPVRF